MNKSEKKPNIVMLVTDQQKASTLLLNPGMPPAPEEALQLRERILEWNETCCQLKEQMGLLWGERGYMEPRSVW